MEGLHSIFHKDGDGTSALWQGWWVFDRNKKDAFIFWDWSFLLIYFFLSFAGESSSIFVAMLLHAHNIEIDKLELKKKKYENPKNPTNTTNPQKNHKNPRWDILKFWEYQKISKSEKISNNPKNPQNSQKSQIPHAFFLICLPWGNFRGNLVEELRHRL